MKIFGYYIQKYDSEKIIDELAKIRIEIGGLKYRLSQLESRPTPRAADVAGVCANCGFVHTASEYCTGNFHNPPHRSRKPLGGSPKEVR